MRLAFVAFAFLSACSEPIVVYEGVDFCAVEEKRKFTQAELDWRSANAPWNLRKDFKTNLTHERECEQPEA
jgi:hypothetical protein